MTDQTVTLRITTDARGLVAGMAVVKREVDGAGASGERAGQRISRGMSGAMDAVKRYGAVVAGAFSARAIIQQADSFANINARLQLATRSQMQYAAAQDQVYAIGQRTFTLLEPTAALYGKLQKATDNLGRSQSDALRVAELVNKTYLISGTSASTMADSIRQFAQGLGAGALRGDELVSVLEGAPRLAEALAESLGTTTDGLRKMGEAGTLTADKIIDALLKQGDAIDREAEKIPLTWGRAWVQAENATLAAIGRIDEKLGVSGGLAKGLQFLVGKIERVPDAFDVWGEAFARAGSVGDGFVADFVGNLDLIGFGFGDLIDDIINEFFILPQSLRTGLTIIVGEFDKLGISVSEQLFLLAGSAEKAWISIQAGASGVAGQIKIIFASAIDSVIGRFGGLITSLSNNAATLGLDNVSASLARMAQQLQTTAGFEQSVRAEVQASAAAYEASRAAIDARNADISRTADALRANADVAIQASLDERDAALRQVTAQRELTAASTETGKAKVRLAAETGSAAKQLREAQKAAREQTTTMERLLDLTGRSAGMVNEGRQAWERYAARVRDLVAAETDAIIAGNNEIEVRGRVREAIDGARAALEQELETLRRRQDVVGNVLADLEREAQFAGLNARERAILTMTLEAEANARELVAEGLRTNTELTADETARIRDQATALFDQIDAREASAQAAEEYQRTWTSSIDRVSGAFGAWITGGIKSFSDFGRALKDIARQTIADIISQFVRSKILQFFGLGGGGAGAAAAGAGAGPGGLLGSLFGGGGAGAGGLLGNLGGGVAGIFGSIFGSEGVIAQGVGFLAQGVGQLALTTGSSILGSLAGGLGQLASVAGPIGAVIAAVSAVDSLTGGRIFGRGFQDTGRTTTLSIGEDGASASATRQQYRRGSLFGGRSRSRDLPTDAGAEAVQAANDLFNFISDSMATLARGLRTQAPEILDAAVRTVLKYDKEGKVIATEYWVDMLGRSFQEATSEGAANRVLAENMIAFVDQLLGTTVNAVVGSAGDAIDGATGDITAAGDRLGSAFDTMIKSIGGTQGEASAIAERWRSDSAQLLDGARLLVLAATDIRNGTALLGDGGSLTQIVDLIEELAQEGESLAATYQRVSASAALWQEALDLSGVSIDQTREELVRFATDITTAAGGLERAQQLWSGYFSRFYSDEERRVFALTRAETRQASEFGDIGLDALPFRGSDAIASFRALFEAALPTLSAEAIVQWLEAADALGAVIDLQGTYNELLQETVSGLPDLLATVEEQIASFAPPATFAERMAAVNAGIDQLIKDAIAMGATEEQLGRIRVLGQLRLGEILEEQRAAIDEYRDFISSFAGDPDAGLSDFNRTRNQVNRETADAVRRANELARAAGLQGAAVEDLIEIETAGARRIAEAALAVEASITALGEQLGYFADQAEAAADTYSSDLGFAHWWTEQQRAIAAAPRIDPQRFGLATQIAGQARDVSSLSRESTLDVLARLRIPFQRLIADLGVDIEQLGSPEVVDRLVNASRMLGIDVLDAAQALGANVGDLADSASILNDAFERSLGRLPENVRQSIQPLLAAYEASTGEARVGARSALIDAVDDLPPQFRAVLAPFLEEINTSAIAEQQLGQIEQSNRYLSAASTDLAEIRRLLAQQAPGRNPADKSTSDVILINKRMLAELERIAKTAESIERKIDHAANRKTLGTA